MLVRHEIKKYLSKFNVILLMILFVLNIGLPLIQYRNLFSDRQRMIAKKKDELIALYITEPDEYTRVYDDFAKRYEKYQGYYYQLLSSGETKIMAAYENQYIDYDDYGDIQLFSELQAIIGRQENYNTKISSLIRDAAFRLSESDDNTFISRYYTELCSHYLPLVDMEFAISEVRGWNEFYSLKLPVILLTIALAATFCSLFTLEDTSGMERILDTTKNGGMATVRAKLCAAGIISVVLTVLFILSPLLIFIFSCGLSSAGQPVQALSDFQYCPYKMTVSEYLTVLIIISSFITALTAVSAALLSKIFKSERFTLIFIVLIALSGIFIAQIKPSTRFYFLQKFSISEIACINILFTRYRGLNILGQCVNYTFFSITLIFALLIILILTTLILSNKTDYIDSHDSESESKISHHTLSLIKNELYKQLICTKNLYIVIAAVIAQCVFCAIYYTPNKNSSELLYMDYISQVRGIITDEKLQRIAEEDEYIKSSFNEYERAKIGYRNGTVTAEEYQKYKNRRDYAEYAQDACKKLCERRDYLLTKAEEHPAVAFVYDEGLNRYFSASPDIIALALILLLGSGVCAVEYESGFHTIMRIAKRGRRDVFLSKAVYTLFVIISLYIVLTGISLIFFIYNYKIDFWDVPVQSMPRFSLINIDISITEYFIIWHIIRLSGFVICVILVFSLSLMIGNQLKVMIVALLLFFIPYLTSRMRMLPINIFGYVNMITPQDITTDLPSYITCVSASLSLLLLARHRWCGRGITKKYR